MTTLLMAAGAADAQTDSELRQAISAIKDRKTTHGLRASAGRQRTEDAHGPAV
jgi:hypothetical protein